jgi:hypothetical protein
MKLWCLLLLLLYWQKLALLDLCHIGLPKRKKKTWWLLESANLPPQQEA